ERKCPQKDPDQEPAKLKDPEDIPQLGERIQFLQPDFIQTPFRWQTLWHHVIAPDGIDECNRRCEIERRTKADQRQQTAERRADHESEGRGRADQAEKSSPLAGFGYISGIGINGREIATRYTINDAPSEKHPQRATQAEDQVARCRAEQADQQDGPPAEAITQ